MSNRTRRPTKHSWGKKVVTFIYELNATWGDHGFPPPTPKFQCWDCMLWLPSCRWSVLVSNIAIGGEGVRGGVTAVANCAELVLTLCYDDHERNTSKCCLIETVNSTQKHCVPGKREKGRETLLDVAIKQLVFCVDFVCTTSTYVTLEYCFRPPEL